MIICFCFRIFRNCFNNILDYEQEKADAGLFMSDESADEVIASCQSFIEDPDNNMLIESFLKNSNRFPVCQTATKQIISNEMTRPSMIMSFLPTSH